MNVLLVDYLGSYIDPDIKIYLKRLGYNIKTISCKGIKNKYEDEKTEWLVDDTIKRESFLFVYSTDFLPLLAKVCYKHRIPYISWSYDTPPNLETTQYMELPTNSIFLFNRKDCEDYRKKGIETVHYMPLAVNTERLSSLQKNTGKFGSEISLVGQLYYSHFSAFRAGLSDEGKGWVDGLVASQDSIVGDYLIPDILTNERLDSMKEAFPDEKASDDIKRRQLSYTISTFLTHRDRLTLLKLLSERFDTALYTEEISAEHKAFLNRVSIRKPVLYFEEMPVVFKSTKINLCPILRDNIWGVPLRALDTMGSCGFLMASFQPGLDELFSNGEELVMYSSVEEAIDLATYYIGHDDERQRIIQNGFERMKQDFRYENRLLSMMEIAGIKK